MSDLVKKFESMMMTVSDKQNMSKESFVEEAKKRADMQEDILKQFKEEDWNELFSSPYPPQAKIAFKHWREKIEANKKADAVEAEFRKINPDIK